MRLFILSSIVILGLLKSSIWAVPESLTEIKDIFKNTNSKQVFTYTMTAGDSPKNLDVEHYTLESGIGIIERGPGFTQYYLCNEQYAVQSWGYEMPESGIAIFASRHPKFIQIDGSYHDKPYHEKHPVEANIPWFQALDYSFSVLSKGELDTVYQLRPRDLVPTKMVIKPKKSGQYPVGEGQNIDALRFTVRIKGFMSFFWSQSYWISTPSLLTLQKTIHTNPKIISTLNLEKINL